MATQGPLKRKSHRKKVSKKKVSKKNAPPAWSRQNFKLPKEKPAVPVACRQCGEVRIPLALHPTKRNIKFCSPACGKIFMTREMSTDDPRR